MILQDCWLGMKKNENLFPAEFPMTFSPLDVHQLNSGILNSGSNAHFFFDFLSFLAKSSPLIYFGGIL